MNNLKLKIKQDPERIAIPVRRFLGVQMAKNREKTGLKKELKDRNGLKTKNSLHKRPFLCLNPKNNQFKKKT